MRIRNIGLKDGRSEKKGKKNKFHALKSWNSFFLWGWRLLMYIKTSFMSNLLRDSRPHRRRLLNITIFLKLLVLSTQREQNISDTGNTLQWCLICEKISEGNLYSFALLMPNCAIHSLRWHRKFIHEIRRDHTEGTGPMIYKEKIFQNMTMSVTDPVFQGSNLSNRYEDDR